MQALLTQTPARPEQRTPVCSCPASPAPAAEGSCGILIRVLRRECRQRARAGALTRAETADPHIHVQPSTIRGEPVPARTCEHLPGEQGRGGRCCACLRQRSAQTLFPSLPLCWEALFGLHTVWPHGTPMLAQCKVAPIRGDAGCSTAFWVHWGGFFSQFSMLFPLGFPRNRLLPPHSCLFQPSAAACPDPAA